MRGIKQIPEEKRDFISEVILQNAENLRLPNKFFLETSDTARANLAILQADHIPFDGSASAKAGGSATLPGNGPQNMFLDTGYVASADVITHEQGHNLGLIHPHEVDLYLKSGVSKAPMTVMAYNDIDYKGFMPLDYLMLERKYGAAPTQKGTDTFTITPRAEQEGYYTCFHSFKEKCELIIKTDSTKYPFVNLDMRKFEILPYISRNINESQAGNVNFLISHRTNLFKVTLEDENLQAHIIGNSSANGNEFNINGKRIYLQLTNADNTINIENAKEHIDISLYNCPDQTKIKITGNLKNLYFGGYDLVQQHTIKGGKSSVEVKNEKGNTVFIEADGILKSFPLQLTKVETNQGPAVQR